MSKPNKLIPLTKDEEAAALAFIQGEERMNRFIGWMIRSGCFSGQVADDIRSFCNVIGKEGK